MKYSSYTIFDDHIVFEFYEFWFSSLRKERNLTLSRIRSVQLHTHPCSMIIDDGETIFFNHDDGERIKAFTSRNQLKVSDQLDIWELLNKPFLDNQISADEKEKDLALLSTYGFAKHEVDAIREKVKWAFLGTMEWNYLGLWDLLAMKQHRYPFYRLTGKKFYWWAMEIASRISKD